MRKNSRKIRTTLKVVEHATRRGPLVFRIGTKPLNLNNPPADLLDPATNRLMAIGYYDPDADSCGIRYTLSEAKMLLEFWSDAEAILASGEKMIAYSTFEFELPFLVARSMLLGIKIPECVEGSPELPWNRTLFADLGATFQAGNFRGVVDPRIIPTLMREVSSDEPFHVLWHKGNAAVEQMSLALHLGWDCAVKMGISAI